MKCIPSFGTSCIYRKQQRMLFEKGIKRNNTKYLKKCTMCVNREIITFFEKATFLNLYIVDIFWSLCVRFMLCSATKLFHLLWVGFRRVLGLMVKLYFFIFCQSWEKEKCKTSVYVKKRFLCSQIIMFINYKSSNSICNIRQIWSYKEN